MRALRMLPAVAALGVAAVFTLAPSGEAFILLGHNLSTGKRDFRVFNNFSDPETNDNLTPDSNFPGSQGAVMAIWKASVEWGSTLHGNGEGDLHQPGDLGSGGANFDFTYQGQASTPGGVDDNTHSTISGVNPGVLAFVELSPSDGFRVRYFDQAYTWDDDPGTMIVNGSWDLQSAATALSGVCLGLGFVPNSMATMSQDLFPNTVIKRSLESDDIAGIQAIYGPAVASKPTISGVSVAAGMLTISGSNFDPASNRVWFTRQDFQGSGAPLEVLNVPSTGGGTSISVAIPPDAQSGDVLVRNQVAGGEGISNAWPYELQGPSCPPPATFCVGAANSVSAGGAVLAVSGSQNVAANDTVLSTTDLPANQFSLYVYGMNQGSIPVGSGTLCVVGPFFRLPAQQIGPAGDLVFNLDFTALSAAGAIAQGETWNFQLWYRDVFMGATTSNLSSAVEVQFCN